MFSLSSSISSSTLGNRYCFLRRFFDLLVDALALAFLTILSILRVLKTNFPFIETLFPFLRSLRYYRSSCISVFSFRRRVRLVFDFLSVEVSRLIYCFARDGRFVAFRTVSSSSLFAFRILVLKGGELAKSVVLRADTSRLRVVGLRRESGVISSISKVERTVIKEKGEIPVFRKLERILRGRKASSRALKYAIVYSTFKIRPGSKQES